MKLGNFSLSLAVKDIHESLAFYQKLGFEIFAGDIDQKWLILKNPDATVIGLFEGMFEQNMLTFNPGWDADCQNVDPFDDVRTIQQHLQAQGVELSSTADAESSGPANIMLKDPDGNPIMIDQHR